MMSGCQLLAIDLQSSVTPTLEFLYALGIDVESDGRSHRAEGSSQREPHIT